MRYCGWIPVDFTHILQGHFTGTREIIWLPQYQRSNPEEYGYIINLNPPRTIIETNEKK